MVQSRAATVAQYVAELDPPRRAVIRAVRKIIRVNMPAGYKESINWGMISYEVPLSRYPTTYNKQPLMYAALASQKNYCALYLMCVYQDKKREKQLRDGFKKAGKKLDMGKSCIRFRSAEDLPLDAIGKIIAGTPVEAFIEWYEACRSK